MVCSVRQTGGDWGDLASRVARVLLDCWAHARHVCSMYLLSRPGGVHRAWLVASPGPSLYGSTKRRKPIVRSRTRGGPVLAGNDLPLIVREMREIEPGKGSRNCQTAAREISGLLRQAMKGANTDA